MLRQTQRPSCRRPDRFFRAAACVAAVLVSEGLAVGQTTTTFQVINNFAPGGATTYFGNTYPDSEVWLYFTSGPTGTASPNVSYLSSGTPSTVTSGTAIPLSAVDNQTFSITAPSVSTKVWAALGATNPFGSGPPGQTQLNIPYALAEWTVNGNAFDNTDVSYEDSFSFPTQLQVVNSNGTQTAGFPLGTTASSVVSALKAALPAPVGPGGSSNPNYPVSPNGLGWSPVPTISGNADAARMVGSSKYQLMGPDTNNNFTTYQYIPSFNAYLGHLQANTPTTLVSGTPVSGYYVDYSGNGGYSGYVTITGSNNAYGMQISNIRVNTGPSAANNWQADPAAGTATTGTITIAANGTTVNVTNTGGYTPTPTGYTMNAFWTDLTIATGASLINGDFETGPIITGTGDFAPGGAQVAINPTFIASISASMATGLLGSDQYMTGMWADPSTGVLAADPGGTMRWFNTTTREQSTQILFDKAWSGGQQFFDPFWATLADLTGMEGYLSPFNDRWSNFSPDFALDSSASSNTVTWQLGVAVPEPSGIILMLTAAVAGAGAMRRWRTA
jgi:hypothetical protein